MPTLVPCALGSDGLFCWPHPGTSNYIHHIVSPTGSHVCRCYSTPPYNSSSNSQAGLSGAGRAFLSPRAIPVEVL